MFCSKCNTVMRSVMRFTPDNKSYKLYRCPKCYFETKPIPLILTPREVITKTRETNNKKRKQVNRPNDYKRQESISVHRERRRNQTDSKLQQS